MSEIQTTARSPKLLTVAAAAERVGVSEKTIRRMYRGQEIAYVRVGRARRYIRIPEDELNRWVTARRIEAVA